MMIFLCCLPAKMAEIWKEWPEAISNTQKIADLCDVQLELGKTQAPSL
jgi:DNA polymerase III alpha subunit